LNELSLNIRNEFTSARTYHDGKWLAIAIDSDKTMATSRDCLRSTKTKEIRSKKVYQKKPNDGT
jgi:hypothetical protein